MTKSIDLSGKVVLSAVPSMLLKFGKSFKKSSAASCQGLKTIPNCAIDFLRSKSEFAGRLAGRFKSVSARYYILHDPEKLAEKYFESWKNFGINLNQIG